MQAQLPISRSIETIGEEISHELGAQMVKDYNSLNPADADPFVIGSKILNQILAQSGCVGIKFHQAYNEVGQKTLVYVGLDKNGNSLVNYNVVDNEGVLSTEKGIVADRSTRPIGDSIIGDDAWTWATE